MAAMQWALQVQPDAVYFLTDGELHEDLHRYLADENHRKEPGNDAALKSPIHTIGFRTGGRYTLRRIAADNGGTFRQVGRPRDPPADPGRVAEP